MIDRRRNYILILDTETANSIECPLVYDIGGIVADKAGNIYETFSFVISDIFLKERELMDTAYYSEKIPAYWQNIWDKKQQVVSFYEARKTILDICDKYNINTIAAYNAHFDINALNNTQRWTTKSKYRFFFPRNIEVICVWNMACQTICNRVTYKAFCENNNLISNHGRNYSTSAENVYRFLILEPQYTEQHKGLDDSLIELEILAACYRSHKAMPYGKGIRRNCWQAIKREV